MADEITSSNKPPSKTGKKLSDIMADQVAGRAGMLHPDDSLQTAGDRMRSCNTGTMSVAEGRHLVGTLDQANPDQKASQYGHDPSKLSVGESMNRDAVYCQEDQDSIVALELMDRRQVDYLPVVDAEMRIIGTVTRADLLESISEIVGPQGHGDQDVISPEAMEDAKDAPQKQSHPLPGN